MFKKFRKLFRSSRARIVVVSVDTDRGVDVIIRKKGDYCDIGVMVVLAMALDQEFADTMRAAVETFNDPKRGKIKFID